MDRLYPLKDQLGSTQTPGRTDRQTDRHTGIHISLIPRPIAPCKQLQAREINLATYTVMMSSYIIVQWAGMIFYISMKLDINYVCIQLVVINSQCSNCCHVSHPLHNLSKMKTNIIITSPLHHSHLFQKVWE